MEELELIASENQVIRCPLEDRARLGKRLLRGISFYMPHLKGLRASRRAAINQ